MIENLDQKKKNCEVGIQMTETWETLGSARTPKRVFKEIIRFLYLLRKTVKYENFHHQSNEKSEFLDTLLIA